MKILRRIAILATTLLSASSVLAISSSAALSKKENEAKAMAFYNAPYTWSGICDRSEIKYNDSSVYVSNVSLYNGTTVSVYGASGTNRWERCDVGNGYIQTENLYLPANCERNIYQNVWENGYYYAHIYFTGNASASGRWTPNSPSESYTSLN